MHVLAVSEIDLSVLTAEAFRWAVWKGPASIKRCLVRLGHYVQDYSHIGQGRCVLLDHSPRFHVRSSKLHKGRVAQYSNI